MKNKITKGLKRFFNSLFNSEKIILISSLVGIASSFLLWFSEYKTYWDQLDDRMFVAYNAFTWIWAVLWYFYFIFLIAIIVLLAMRINSSTLTNFIKKQSWIYIFLTWEALFVSVCALLIYSAYSFNTPYSNIWIWLYLSIWSQVVWLFWAHYFFINTVYDKIKK